VRTAVPATPPAPEPAASTARELVDAHHAVTRILRLALEVLDGRRSHLQLEAHFAPEPLRYWRAALRPRAPVRRGRMRLCLPRPGVAEVAVPCQIDGVVRALAARFERVDTRWCCTVVRLLGAPAPRRARRTSTRQQTR
jgi:hypothetical protein